ncbi:hypothetical protein [Candidatus Entotheonella palauensis]|uniref:Uncharacterized protein n=1 Tax=Candidatus Entotheonella gemina TaxID=1429439 RepID=W4M200_9BACT|nr:hypothetical protein [Candidatus Entotheonella palauensis]ETX04225.1 MAG: hypothetical protein ETSY2_29990 [Candidatus Entotheonella gemina]
MLALNRIPVDLNAILIKELRQELRVRGFVWSFIGFHIAMIIFTLSTFTAPDPDNVWTSMWSTALFWMMLAIPLFIIVPARAFTAFSKEANAKELELIFLTRTSSRQIVFYKWCALCLQGILLLTAALPYVIVRYVVGSLDLLDAFNSLGLLFLSTMLLTAVALVISAQSAHRRRFSAFRIIVCLVIGLPFANQIILFFVFGFSRLSIFGSISGTGSPIVAFIYAMFLLLLLFEYAASHISTQAENHASVKRILGMLALGTGWIFHAAGLGNPGLINISVGLYLLLICINALCEDPIDVQSIYAPFVKGSSWKRYVGIWLYPGWPSGVVYTVSMCVLYFTAMPMMHQAPLQLGGVATAAGLCLPILFTNTLWPRFRKKWWPYLLVQTVLLIVSFALIQDAPRHSCPTLYGTDYISSLFPISAVVLIFESRRFCPVNEVTGLASIGIFLLLALPWWRAWRHVRDTENRTRAALEEHPQHV